MTDTGTSEKWEVSEGYRPERKIRKSVEGYRKILSEKAGAEESFRS